MMATLRGVDTTCLTCGKTASVFTCGGCSRSFCLDHANKHRQVLEQQMKELIASHNRLVESSSTDDSQQQCHLLMKHIDRWEEESIEKIRVTAEHERERLANLTEDYDSKIRRSLGSLTKQLSRARDAGDFFEKELEEWGTALQKVEAMLHEQQTRKLYQYGDDGTYVPRISLNGDESDAVEEIDVTRHRMESAQRGKGHSEDGYSLGSHQLRFNLVDYHARSRVLIGIMAKQTASITDASDNPTFYGWGTDDFVYLHGVEHRHYNGYHTDMQTDDVFQLIVDCDRRIIRLENERTGTVLSIQVDVTHCPLPWQPHIRVNNN